MVLLSTLMYFVIAIALLITVHEWGHFLAARAVGVKVLRFSVGFGKPIIQWRDKKQTEYVIALFPIGGYVKMLDENEGPVSPEEQPFAFNRQSVWARILVVVAGPLFNFLFAIIALWLMYVIGIVSLAPIVGKVAPQSIAAQASLKPMDEILTVDNESVGSWRQFQMLLMPRLGSKTTLVLDVRSSKDDVTRRLTLDLKRWTLDSKQPNLLESLGLTPYVPKFEPYAGEVIADYPAAKGGMKTGDKIIALDGVAMNEWLSVVEVVRQHPNQTLIVSVQRGQKKLDLTIVPIAETDNGKLIGRIGVKPMLGNLEPQWYKTHRYSALAAFSPAIEETWKLTWVTFRIIGKFITGDMSVKTISGPIGIAQGAGQSGRSGLAYYLAFLALVSISLGVLNLLPIPMLDGGHLLYYLIEVILGRPVPEKIQEIGMSLGLLVLSALIILAVFNDVTRLLT